MKFIDGSLFTRCSVYYLGLRDVLDANSYVEELTGPGHRETMVGYWNAQCFFIFELNSEFLVHGCCSLNDW